MKCGCEYRHCPKCGTDYRCWSNHDKTGTFIQWIRLFCKYCGAELKTNSEEA